jgi:hypothetical protein
MYKNLLNINKQNEIKIEIFDFENEWNLVEPHLDNPKLLKLLNKAMRRFSIYHKPMILPMISGHGDTEKLTFMSSVQGVTLLKALR